MGATLGNRRAGHYATEMGIEKGMPEDEIVNAHPVVRVHPETGRRVVFVNGNYTRHFEGWSEEDSAPILEYLFAQYGRMEYTYRHHWEPGDLLIWDNRCAQHAVIGDTQVQERVLHRTTVAGDVPR